MIMRAQMHARMEVKTRVQALMEVQGPPSPVHPPLLVQEIPLDPKEIIKRIAEVGRLPQSLPTQQLAQMAVEAGPSTFGGEEPAHKKLQPTMGGEAPWKGEFL